MAPKLLGLAALLSAASAILIMPWPVMFPLTVAAAFYWCWWLEHHAVE